MNVLSTEKRIQVIAALVEGASIRSIVRMTGVAKNTISKLLLEIGVASGLYQDRVMRNLSCKRIEADEIWSFVGCKQKTKRMGGEGEGDVWTWVALDTDSKLVPCWLVGGRDAGYAHAFMQDLASRLSHRVQLTTDGHAAYLDAVDSAFGTDIDYAQLVKHYGKADNIEASQHRYSPAHCTGSTPKPFIGDPKPYFVSTSYIERQNLTMRMHMRRFTRLTNAFSKKLENHAAAIALHFLAYNFCRKHKAHGMTPAQKAGLADRVWTIADIVALLDAPMAKAAN